VIDTEQKVTILAPISVVWAYARDIGGWATLMPGLQDCAIIDEDKSRWTLKVGVGALVRTVRVLVHVDRWAGPGEADFSYRLEGDPVSGGGVYRARSVGPCETEVTLGVRVVGEGPMAPMLEAMGKPFLPKLARGFAEQSKREIKKVERPVAAPSEALAPVPARASRIDRLVAWLRCRSGAAAFPNHRKQDQRP
jgi:carbon monoxide dehydrogenase subunit G